MGQGTKVPGSELARVLLADSLPGANWPGSEKAVNPAYTAWCKNTVAYIKKTTGPTDRLGLGSGLDSKQRHATS